MFGGSEEQPIISNKFGTISDREVIFLSNKGLFSSAAREEIPLKQIASVNFYKQKSLAIGSLGGFGILFFIIINLLFWGSLIAKIGGSIVLVVGIWIAYVGLSGIPTVVITTASGTVTQATGWPNHKNEAKAFALVLRQKIAG